jgi:electron transfer flavoprotein beta subunit
VKVAAIFKCARNPVDARVKLDGSVSWEGIKLAASDDDPAAMQIARALSGGDEIVALTIGDGDQAWAAARGAARTILVEDARAVSDSSVTGFLLAACLRRLEGVQAVVIGDSAWDYGIVSALAGQLGWPAVAGVTEAEAAGAGLKVIRKLGNIRQVLALPCPVVLAAAAGEEEKNPPGMRDILAARKKPTEKLAAAALNPPPERTLSRGFRYPDAPSARIIDGRDPQSACAELVAALRADGAL